MQERQYHDLYDEEVLPAIGADPNRIAQLTRLDFAWRRNPKDANQWIATKNPPQFPTGGKASRIVYRVGKIGPLAHGEGPAGTWLQMVAGSQVEPTGDDRRKAIERIAECYGIAVRISQRRRVSEHRFETVEGVEVRKWRLDPKSFEWERRWGTGWKKGLEGLSPRLYRIDEVLRAIAANETVHLCEGCKDADAIRSLRLVATTAPNGTDLKDHHVEELRGARVVILPDADSTGRDYALKAGERLEGVAKTAEVVELFPFLDDGKDAAKWAAMQR